MISVFLLQIPTVVFLIEVIPPGLLKLIHSHGPIPLFFTTFAAIEIGQGVMIVPMHLIELANQIKWVFINLDTQI